MLPRVAAFVIWAAAAAGAVYWALKLWARPLAVPTHAVVVSTADGFSGDPRRVLGADALPGAPAALPSAPADPRFRLIGVVAPRGAGAGVVGVALIATDGRPPKAYRVGAPVDGELVLLSVRSRGASLGPRGQAAQVDLQLPALPPPSSAAGTPPRPALPLAPRTPQAMLPPLQPQPQMQPQMQPPPQDNNIEVDTPPPDSPMRPMLSPSAGIRPPT